MKLTVAASALALLTTSIDTVSAGCYTSGAKWEDKINARFHSGRACSGYDGKQGVFQGVFNPGQTKYVCIQYSINQKFEFWITNLNKNAGFDLADEHCAQGLWNEIDGCEHGGQSDNSGWRFRSDPNHGLC